MVNRSLLIGAAVALVVGVLLTVFAVNRPPTASFQDPSPEEIFAVEQQAYLDQNAERAGVTVRDSGLQYRVLAAGEGKSPEPGDLVTVHYEGKLIDGTVFDSSYQRGEPAQFPSDRLIAGWVEALQLMSEGDKWELVIPADIAYGDRGAGARIPPGATLIFTVELISVDS